MKKVFQITILFLFTFNFTANAEKFIQLSYQSMGTMSGLYNYSGIPYGFKYNSNSGTVFLKGKVFNASITLNFLERIDFRINGKPYRKDKNLLFFDPSMVKEGKLIFTYKHPNDPEVRSSDTLEFPKIYYLSVNNKSFAYNKTYSPILEAHFDDGTKTTLVGSSLARFKQYYGVTIILEYMSKDSTNTELIETSNYLDSEIFTTFSTKGFTGALNEYVRFKIKADDFFQEINVPLKAEDSYIFNNSGANGFNGSTGRNGSNVRLLIYEVQPELYSFQIEIDGSLSKLGLFNPTKSSITINASGGNGGVGTKGANGENAGYKCVGPVYKAGMPGRNGSNGGNGGNGGFVSIICPNSFKPYLSSIVVQINGGNAGRGGEGGKGGTHQFASEQEYRDASWSQRRASDGYEGYHGQSGMNGRVDYVFTD